MSRPAWPSLGFSYAEAKQLTAALQAQIVPAQVAVLGWAPSLVRARTGQQGPLRGSFTQRYVKRHGLL